MPKLVHVIGPGPLQRYEQEFPDTCPNAQILKQLHHNKGFFGRSRSVMKTDKSSIGMEVPHPDHNSPYILDDPATVVCIGVASGRNFVETERLQGPPLTPPEPEQSGLNEDILVPQDAQDQQYDTDLEPTKPEPEPTESATTPDATPLPETPAGD